jgi:pimeloyl-ACP methyl ester carboxylesterase
MAEEFLHGDGIAYVLRAGSATAPRRLLLLHGWKQPASSLLPTVTTLQQDYAIIGLDTPGNGVAPEPPSDWAIQDYVRLVAAFMAAQPAAPTVIVCHSFGARLAMHLAAQGAPWLQGIVVIGGHGLRPIRSLSRRIKVWTITRITKVAGLLDRVFGLGLKPKWASRFGSADYRAAGAMRDVFVRIVADDVSPLLPQVRTPVALLYGANDTETPPAMGQRYHALLPNSELNILPGQDHYSVLTSPVVATLAKRFITKVLHDT